MERKTFVLTQTKEFRRHVRLFLKTKDGKVDQRNITFTTEHKVSEKERNKNARKISAEYSTSDEKIYDGLLRSHAYGKTFVLDNDPKGKLKREPFDITPVDAKKVALKNLFKSIDLEFDPDKGTEVLEEEYRIHITAKTGVKIGNSTAKDIPHVPINLEQEMKDQVDMAKKAYEDKYGEPIPEEFADDKAFLSALSDPKFDAKAYMDKVSAGSDGKTESIESLREQYKEKLGVNVPTPKKNDAAWIKSKIA